MLFESQWLSARKWARLPGRIYIHLQAKIPLSQREPAMKKALLLVAAFVVVLLFSGIAAMMMFMAAGAFRR
jgi:hypothetical protein